VSEKAIVKNAADEEQVKKAKSKVESRNDRRLNDVREVLNTKRGRRWYWSMMKFCRIFETSNADEHQIFYNEGMRNVGLKLLADVNEAAPEAYLVMLRENQEDTND
jgi:hypothetical protein